MKGFMRLINPFEGFIILRLFFTVSDSEYLFQILSNLNRAQTIGLDGSHSSTSNITLEGILRLETVSFLSKIYKGLDQKSLHIFLIFRKNFTKKLDIRDQRDELYQTRQKKFKLQIKKFFRFSGGTPRHKNVKNQILKF